MPSNLARRDSRRLAVESLFAWLEREGLDSKQCFEHVLNAIEEKKDDQFAWSLVDKAVMNFAKIKVLIRALAPDFPYAKITPINRTLLVLGIAELKFFDTPPAVVINEYIELSKQFGEAKSAPFINGVLDNYRKNSDLPAHPSSSPSL